jgi:hypothetical protein
LLIEKAFSKLYGNYHTIEGGWMVDAGNTFLGTGGSSIDVTTSTVDLVWTTALNWDTKGYVMTAGAC